MVKKLKYSKQRDRKEKFLQKVVVFGIVTWLPKDDFSRNLIGSLLIEYQMIYHSLTIFGILVVNTENKLCLERTQLILGL